MGHTPIFGALILLAGLSLRASPSRIEQAHMPPEVTWACRMQTHTFCAAAHLQSCTECNKQCCVGMSSRVAFVAGCCCHDEVWL